MNASKKLKRQVSAFVGHERIDALIKNLSNFKKINEELTIIKQRTILVEKTLDISCFTLHNSFFLTNAFFEKNQDFCIKP